MNNYNLHYKGSEWRKWDLHIHTPFSIEQHYKNTKENWEKFINALESLPSDVKVLGITDYYFIDGYAEVMGFKNAGRLKNIEKIFPILEFRLDTFGSGNENKLQKINLHILFDLDEGNLIKEIKKVREEFIDKINLSPADRHRTKKLSLDNFINEGGTLKDGFDSFIPSTKQVFDIINSETWRDRTFLFLGYKEWSNLEKNQQLRPLKEDLYASVSAFLSNNAANNEANQNWLNEFGDKRLLHSLDIHGFDLLDTYEFDKDNNQLPSEKYHCHTWIKSDPTFEGLKQIIYEPELRVAIQPSEPETKTGYQIIDRIQIENQLIHNDHLELNPSLNSIIGGRSTGKSILLGAIAKKLKTERPVRMKDPDYDNFIQSVSDSIRIIWKDGKEENNREIEYFHQGYMYNLATDENELSKLIQDILKQKGKEPIITSYQKSITENKKRITDLLSDFYQIARDIREKDAKAREKGDKKGIEDEISKLTEGLSKLHTVELSLDERETYEKVKNAITHANHELVTLQSDLTLVENLKGTSFIKENISYDLTSISDERRVIVDNAYAETKFEFYKLWQNKLDSIISNIQIQQQEQKKLIETLSVDVTFQKVANAYSNNVQLNEYNEKIALQKNKLFEINAISEELSSLKTQRDAIRQSIRDNHSLFFKLSNELIPLLSDNESGLAIKALVKFDQSRYRQLLHSCLNLQGYTNQSLANFEYQTESLYQTHVSEFFDRLIEDSLTLKGGHNNETLSNALLADCFYYITYDIEYEDDDFRKMSDGKKAFVVLKLLLDFSDKDCPILIDQPEDDLDNRAIYTDLVQYLRRKKKLRQIIVATHNPNIVVGADSELVICANQDGLKNYNRGRKKFQYVSGSLEHSIEKKKCEEILEGQGVREHVCEILEGGDIAFRLRDNKYGLN